MTRTFSLSLIVALLLIFAVTEATRGQTDQTDRPKVQSRGSARYHSNPTTESSSSSTSTTRSPRDKSSRSEVDSNLKQHESHFARESSSRSRSKLEPSKTTNDSVATSQTNARHLNPSIDNLRNRSRSHIAQAPKEETIKSRQDDNKESVPESQTPKRQTASRRVSSDASLVWVDNAKLDLEVTKSPDHLRSRTGRKIYANNNGRESKSQVNPSGNFSNKNLQETKSPRNGSEAEEARLEHSKAIENVASKVNTSRKLDAKGANNSSKIKERDVSLSGSESVRVDIPLTLGNNEDANSNLVTSATTSSASVSPRQISRPVKEESNDIARSSAKTSRQSDRSKPRGRFATDDSNQTANSGTRRAKFDDTANAETNGRSPNSRRRSSAKNANARDRSVHKSRDAAATEARNSGRNRNADSEINTNGRTEVRRSSSRRIPDGKRRSNDNRAKIAETKVDEQDARTQPRSRSRTVSDLDITTIYIPKATIAETTTVSALDTEITTSNSAITTIKSSTTTGMSSSTERVYRSKGREESTRPKKPPKEDFFNHGLGFRGRKSTTEESSSRNADLKSTTPKSETQLQGNPGWTLRRRPGHVNYDTPSSTSTSINQDQTNEIILANDLSSSTETSLSNAKAGRRGSTKRPKAKYESNTVSGVAKSTTRGNKTFHKSESFSLPKRLESEESDNYPPAFRARLSQLKNSNSKVTGAKSTTRASLQATKPSTSSLFSERSKLKLDLARRLIKPELNVDEKDFDVTTTPYSGKSTDVSAVSESRNVEKTTKATNKLSGARVTHGSPIIGAEKSIARGRWKILDARKSSKDGSIDASIASSTIATKKSRVSSERTIASLPVVEGPSITEFNIPRRITVSYRGTTEEAGATTIDMTKIPRYSQDETSMSPNSVDAADENNVLTTVEPLDKMSVRTIGLDKQTYNVQKDPTTTEFAQVYTTKFPHEVTLSPTVVTPRSTHLSSADSQSEEHYPVYIPDARKFDSLKDEEKTSSSSDATRSSFRPRYTKQQRPDKITISMVTSRTAGPTSRYVRKKSGVFTPYDAIPKPLSTESALTQTKRRDFRPRTATYRRHSEVPTSQLVQQSTVAREDPAGVTITPKPTKDRFVTPTARSSPSEPLVSVRIDTSNDTKSQVSGVAETSNGNSGSSNIFNPTRSTFLNGNTTTLLEQLRSTVAPLLNTLGNKTPVFSAAYSNVDTGNSAGRITPNGSPPRFSARYKGAELFVRKPSSGQAVVPSITTSSTTASTPIEVFPTKVPEDSGAVAPPSWTEKSIITTSSSDVVLNHINANNLR